MQNQILSLKAILRLRANKQLLSLAAGKGLGKSITENALAQGMNVPIWWAYQNNNTQRVKDLNLLYPGQIYGGSVSMSVIAQQVRKLCGPMF